MQMIRFLPLLLAAFVFAATQPAEAEEFMPGGERSFDGFRLAGYGENDSKGLKPNKAHDRYYTNGVALSLTLRNEFAAGLTQWIPFGDAFDDQHRAAGLTGGQLMHTPQDISDPDLIEDDRPYAGYFYAGIFFQRSNDHTFDHVQLDLGVVGPSAWADKAQIEVHQFGDGVEPRGWKHQLDDEPTIQLYLRKKWRTTPHVIALNDIPPIELQLIPQVEFAIGTVYRHIAGGALLRIGFNLPDDFGPDRLADIASFTAPASPRGGGYLFIRIGGKAIEHNLFLEGNTWKDSHHVDAETLVGEVQIGLALELRFRTGSLNLAYSQTFLSEEFEGQDGGHSFGAVAASWVFRF